MKTKVFAALFFLFAYTGALACPVCEKQQPKLLRGITHGTGPQSDWDWVIVGAVALVTLLTFFYSVKFLVSPGERDAGHIKQAILYQDPSDW